jgi:serine/threonine protein kinase
LPPAALTVRPSARRLCLPATEWDEEEGDREYLAPEILKDMASPAADIFSAGLVLYQVERHCREQAPQARRGREHAGP